MGDCPGAGMSYPTSRHALGFELQEDVAGIREKSACIEIVFKSGVEPTNNAAERALGELVVRRKIIGTLRNEKGTRTYEILSTLLATRRRNGLNPSEMLPDALTEAWQMNPKKKN